jgi:hypothetical protein
MSHVFTNAEYADMLYVYGSCDGSVTAAVQEYRRRFPMRRIPDTRVFSNVFDILRERGTLPSAHASSARARQHVKEQENILDMIQRSHTTSTRRLSIRISVLRTRVWQILHDASLTPFHPQLVQNLHPGDSALRLEFCHWLHATRQLLPLILFTDEATFTRNGIRNVRFHDNPHGTVETNFQRRFSISVWCGVIDDMLTGPVILDDHMTGHNYLRTLDN